MQCNGYGFIMPLYCIVHLVYSKTARAGDLASFGKLVLTFSPAQLIPSTPDLQALASVTSF